MRAPVARGQAAMAGMIEALMKGRPERGNRRRRVLAAIRHAAAFGTWYSLTQEGGLSDAEAIDAMLGAVEAARA
jgi:hypothetical protein